MKEIHDFKGHSKEVIKYVSMIYLDPVVEYRPPPKPLSLRGIQAAGISGAVLYRLAFTVPSTDGVGGWGGGWGAVG